ncbi:MAG: ATP-binding protein, partial [Bacillota bacterium]|nr:ATP-binding protein [Bacillota bacterium]
LTKIHHQNEDLRRQMETMHRNQEEFSAITENMSEGLIVISSDKHILSVNRSALQLLDAKGENYEGAHILELSRNLSLQKVADQALEGASAEETFSRGEGEQSLVCRLHASPAGAAQAEGEVKGAIILVLDVTETQKTELLRREFSANVSHELKTPLTAISGFAEMMQSGMVKAEDYMSFSGRIYDEAQRLIALIDEVLEISRRDEKNIDSLWETVDLYDTANTVIERLTSTAKRNDIEVKLLGGSAEIQAVPRLIDELIYNLVENAIKYSNGPANVTVTVENNGSAALLTVEDQGIGIPEEYQSRVFERFFRVDQSHTRATGGTGLGLAIVKHVVSYHHGRIALQSGENGEGTKITVSFPL